MIRQLTILATCLLAINAVASIQADDPLHPAVEAFFTSDDPFVKDTVLPNIEKHRKADAILQFRTPDGRPVVGAEVSVELLRHQFHFGCAPRRELAVDGPYRDVWLGIWEYAVPENAQKWASIERSEDIRDYETSDAMVEPHVIYESFDSYTSCDIKLHVSEFGIREGTIQHADHLETDCSASNADQPDEGDGPAWTEERKAEYFVKTIMTCFSHPAVRAFNLWGMGPGNMFMDGNRLIEEDYSPRLTYHALRCLVKEKLRTHASGATDADGRFKFRGFHGLYRVRITKADGTVTESKFTLTRDEPLIQATCE